MARLVRSRQAAADRRAEPELDQLSNILRVCNDLYGNVPWTDTIRVRRLITEEIPAKVAADLAYQNARNHSDRQNARIEHDKPGGADEGSHGAIQAVHGQ